MASCCIALVLGFLLIAAADPLNVGLSVIETIAAHDFRNGTHLIIESELEGKMRIHVGNYDNVHVKVNKSAPPQSDLDDIRVDVNQNDADQFNLRIYTASPPTTAPPADSTTDEATTDVSSSGNAIQPVVSSIISMIAVGFFLQNIRVFLLLGICFLPFFCMQVNPEDMPRADIDIYIPKNQALQFVSLKSAKGVIKVAEALFTEAHFKETKLECLSGELHEECPSCCNGHGDCINGECQCSPSFNGTECSETQNSPYSFKLFVNPLDSRIMAAFTPEGDEIVAYGNKSVGGTSETLSGFKIIDNEGIETYVDLDDNGRIEMATDSDGNEMGLTWDNDTMLFVSVVIGNGTEQITLHVNLSALNDSSADPPSNDNIEKRSVLPLDYTTGPSSIRSASVRSNDLNNMDEQHLPYASVKRANGAHQVITKRNTVSEKETVIIVSVNACDQSLDGTSVAVDVLNEYNQSTGEFSSMETYPATSTGVAGQYRAIIPTAPVNESTIKTCDTIVTAVETPCNFYTKIQKTTKKEDSVNKFICGTIATDAFAVTKVPVLWYSIYKFCKNIFKGIDVFCNALGTVTIGDGIGDTDFSEQICESVTDVVDNFIDYFSSDLVLLTPKVLIQGNYVKGMSQTVDLEEGSTMHLAINYEVSTPQILDYYSSPYDPAPGQSYVATVYFICYSNKAFVFMSISGTDDYYFTKFCTGGPVCQLHVPGAAALVKDTITVTITDPPGSQYSTERVIYIVF